MLRLNTNKSLCPFIQEPFDDCYCVKMSSQDIERTVYLCSKNFETCEIYKSGNDLVKKNENSSEQDSVIC